MAVSFGEALLFLAGLYFHWTFNYWLKSY